MLEEFQEAWTELTQPGSQFAMKDIEVRGVPMRVYEAAPPSMRFVWELATGYGDRDYVVFEDERYTYAESDAVLWHITFVMCTALARAIVSRLRCVTIPNGCLGTGPSCRSAPPVSG
jgi:hypothetical protein